MERTQDAWNQVGERFTAWGRHVADRYKESGAGAGEAGREAQHKLEEAARDVTDVLDRAFKAFEQTVRDEGAKKDLKDAVRALGDAVSVTVSETGEQIRRRVGKPAGQGGSTEKGGSAGQEPSSTPSDSEGSGGGAEAPPS